MTITRRALLCGLPALSIAHRATGRRPVMSLQIRAAEPRDIPAIIALA